MVDDRHGGTAGDESSRLGATLRFVGIGKLILAALTLTLAFTGYDTPRAVNANHLFIGGNLFILGCVCLSVGKSFGLASDERAPPALGEALRKANRLFGYYLVLVILAVLGVGFDTVTFLGRILSR